MKSFNVLARIAHGAYERRLSAYDDQPKQVWSDLSVEQQAAWIEAVKAVVAEVATIR